MRISVITAAHNAASYLEGLHESLLAQTHTAFEWIVVDDGSADETWELLVKLRERSRLAIIVLKHEYSRGAAAARNSGIAVARGEFLKMVDADDFIESRHLEVQLSRALAERGTIVASPLQFVAGIGEGISIIQDKTFAELSFGSTLFTEYIITGGISHCACLFPREVVEAIGGYREDLATDEDGWLLLRLLLAGHRIVPEYNTFYSYRIWHTNQDSSLSNNSSVERLQAREAVSRMLLDGLEASRSDEALLAAAAYRLAMVGFEYGVAHRLMAHQCLRDSLALDLVLPRGPFSFAIIIAKSLGFDAGIAAYSSYRWLSRARQDVKTRISTKPKTAARPVW